MTISDKIRIYELSRDLNLENKDILDAAQKLSISVKSHSSSISAEEAKKIKNLINKKNSDKKILSIKKPSIKKENFIYLFCFIFLLFWLNFSPVFRFSIPFFVTIIFLISSRNVPFYWHNIKKALFFMSSQISYKDNKNRIKKKLSFFEGGHQLEKLEFALAIAQTNGDEKKSIVLRKKIVELGGNVEEPGT